MSIVGKEYYWLCLEKMGKFVNKYYWLFLYKILKSKTNGLVANKILYELFMIKQNSSYESKVKLKQIDDNERYNYPTYKVRGEKIKYIWFGGLVKTWSLIYRTNHFHLEDDIDYYGDLRPSCTSKYLSFVTSVIDMYDDIDRIIRDNRSQIKVKPKFDSLEMIYQPVNINEEIRYPWKMTFKKLKKHNNEYFFRRELSNHPLILKEL